MRWIMAWRDSHVNVTMYLSPEAREVYAAHYDDVERRCGLYGRGDVPRDAGSG